MPRVNRVKKARKKQGECGKCGCSIGKGDAYVWWKFRYGGRYVRCDKPECGPRASDLTQSAFLSQIYDLQDREFDGATSEDLESQRDDVVSDIESLRDDTQGSLENMPEGLQQGDTGQLLQERIDGLESTISELEGVNCEIDIEEEPVKGKKESQTKFDERHAAWEQEREDALQAIRDELASALENLPS